MNGNVAEWVEIIEPQSQQRMFANLHTGECCWDPPEGAPLRKTNDRQWWELFDTRTNRYYYYNAKSKETVWQRPAVDEYDIIPLSKLQGVSRESQTQTTSLSSTSTSSPHSKTNSNKSNNSTIAAPPAKERQIVYAQDFSDETGLVSIRDSPEPLAASFKDMSLNRRMTGQPYEPPSPTEKSYDTPSSARNRFPYDSSSPTRSMISERKSVDEETGEVWSKDAPKNPLSDPTSKTLKKESGALFKHIVSYMGDRKTKNNQEQLALSICESAAAKQENADEACLLLMKQLTKNGKADSVKNGWELLAIVLALAIPSKKVSVQVSQFAERNADELLDPPEVRVSYFATQVLRRLSKTTPRPKPSPSSVHEARVHIFHPPQFGAKIDELMKMQEERFPHLRIPWIECTLIDLVLNAGGSSTEGIFRVAADPEQLSTAKARLDQWLVPAVTDAHVAACLLKAWLRELPEPLVPSSLYDRALAAGENPQEACHLPSLLSKSSELVLARLIRLLHTLASEECVVRTKMDASNLAMVIAPNVLRCESDDPRVLYENTRREMNFIRTLIQHYKTDFAV